MGTDLKPLDNCVPDATNESESNGEGVAKTNEGVEGEEGEHEQHVTVLGAMDLGGSSTQIVYQPKSKQHDTNEEEEAAPLTMPGRTQSGFHPSTLDSSDISTPTPKISSSTHICLMALIRQRSASGICFSPNQRKTQQMIMFRTHAILW